MTMRILGMAAAFLAVAAPLRADDKVRVVYEPTAATAVRLDTNAAQEIVRLALMNMLTKTTDEKGRPDSVQADKVEFDRRTITFRYGKNLERSGTISLVDVDPRVIYNNDKTHQSELIVGPASVFGRKDDTPDMFPRRGNGFVISRSTKDSKDGAPSFRDFSDALLALKLRSSMETDPAFEARFQQAARTYRAASPKPELPESARRFRVQADAMVREKNFNKAIALYEQLLETAPWWPEGHFNLAVQLSSAMDFASAIVEMKRYLTLVPGAPDARDAQDLIYEWELKAPARRDAPVVPPDDARAPRVGGLLGGR
jgi:tetratricopeptide (TPR) repeat protein